MFMELGIVYVIRVLSDASEHSSWFTLHWFSSPLAGSIPRTRGCLVRVLAPRVLHLMDIGFLWNVQVLLLSTIPSL